MSIISFFSTFNYCFEKVYLKAELCTGEMFYVTCIDEKEKLEPLYHKYKGKYHCVFQIDIYTKHQWLEENV